MTKKKQRPKTYSIHSNKIDLSFGEAVDRLLAYRPAKKKPAPKRRKKSGN
jgi:hypothetical protein